MFGQQPQPQDSFGAMQQSSGGFASFQQPFGQPAGAPKSKPITQVVTTTPRHTFASQGTMLFWGMD
jgi:hypothetical protein